MPHICNLVSLRQKGKETSHITGFGKAPAYQEFYIVWRYAAQVNPHHTHSFLISHQNRNHPCKSKPTKGVAGYRYMAADGQAARKETIKPCWPPRSRRTTDLLLHACYAKSSRSRDRDLIKHPIPKTPKLTRKFSKDDMNVFPSSTRMWHVVKCRVISVDGVR